jgi:MFS family permease
MSLRLLLRFVPIFLMGLLYGILASAPGFYNSHYLIGFGLTEETVGLAFAGTALLSTAVLLLLPLVTRHIGARAAMLSAGIVYILAALMMVASTNTTHAVLSFACLLTASLSLFSLIDILIETKTGHDEQYTGRIRGVYLSVVNAGFVIGPFAAGYIILYATLSALYLATALVTVVFLLVAISATKTFKDPRYPKHNMRELVEALRSSPEIRITLWINLILRTLYGATLTYFGIYVITYAHISETLLGVMAGISIMPFVLLQYPLGIAADKMGERDLLATGFAISLFGILLIPIVPLTIVWLTIALALVHTGAAFVELLVESHFFKQVQGKNAALISTFRLIIPLSYITGPLIGTIAISLASIEMVFVGIGILLLIGVPLSLSLRK